MPATRTGTATQVDASGGNGSTPITVPADCTGIVVQGAHWDGDNGSTLSALTLNGVGFTITQVPDGAGSGDNGVFVARLANPAVGSQTLAWTWSAGGARSSGGGLYITFVKDIHASAPFRDADVFSASTELANVEVTIDTDPADLIIAQCESDGTPALAGTVYTNNHTINSLVTDLSEVAAAAGPATTTTVTMTGEQWSTMSAISIQGAAAAGSLVGRRDPMAHMVVR